MPDVTPIKPSARSPRPASRVTSFPVLVGVALLAATSAAPAQDSPHPLEAALTRQLRSAQFRASGRCRETQTALFHVQAAGFVDRDADGRGEVATMPELLGLEPWHGRPEDAAGVMTWPGAFVAAPGVIEADGYLYRIEMPKHDGQPTLALADVDPDRAEGPAATVVAWPARYGVTGTFTYSLSMADEHDAMIANVAEYSGHEHAPPLAAATHPPTAGPDTDSGAAAPVPLVAEGRGRDGQSWFPRADERVNPLTSTFTLPVRADAPWRDGQSMVDQLAAANRRIRELAGVEQDAPPPRLRFVDHAGMHAALVREQQPLFERFGSWEQAQGALALVALAVPAKYVASEHVLLFAPRSLELAAFMAEIDDDRLADAVRAILVHEAVHSVDSALYDQPATFAACRNEGDLLCWIAMSEGHAQQVARQICTELGIDEGFADMEALVHDDEAHRAAPEALRAALVTLSFPYVQGEHFLDAVAARTGPEAVAALLRSPPTRPAEIERPELWFDRESRTGPDLLEVLERLALLEPEDATVQETPLLRASLALMLSIGAGERAEAVADGVEDGQTRSAAGEAGTSQTVTTVLRCRDVDAARAYVQASWAFQRAQDAQYENNPALRIETKYTSVPGGYRNTRTLHTAAGTIGGAVISLAEGRFVLEATLSRQAAAGLALTERLDSVVQGVARSLRAEGAERGNDAADDDSRGE